MSKENWRQTRQNDNDSPGFSSETFWKFSDQISSALKRSNVRVLGDPCEEDSLKVEIWKVGEGNSGRSQGFGYLGRPEIYVLHHDEDIWVCNLRFSFNSNTFHSWWLTAQCRSGLHHVSFPCLLWIGFNNLDIWWRVCMGGFIIF